jgi:hypothetical protein
MEEADFLGTRALREAIHAREGERCFYCLRRVTAATRCIDHVIPQARNGSNSYRNLASSCAECNAQKCESGAEDFLRWLYREGRLTGSELAERLRALKKLARGELRPAIPKGEDVTQRGGALLQAAKEHNSGRRTQAGVEEKRRRAAALHRHKRGTR